LGEGTGLKITIAKYYSPSGRVIDGKGITPDYVVESEKTILDKPEMKAADDEQIKAALDYILQGKIPPKPPETKPSKEPNSTHPSDM